jgi:hypothetical protein
MSVQSLSLPARLFGADKNLLLALPVLERNERVTCSRYTHVVCRLQFALCQINRTNKSRRSADLVVWRLKVPDV